MGDRGGQPVNRRDFLQTGAAVTATAAAMSATRVVAGPSPEAMVDVLPRRPLGKTGVDVTIINQGTWRAPSSLDRLLRLAYANGVRYVDTADCYGTEPGVAKWLESDAKIRKSIFLATKDHPKTPRDLIAQLDKRLAVLKTDYVDLFFIHGIGGKDQLDWPKSKEFKETCEALKKSGKTRFVGFSCHDALKAEFLMSAAEGGFVDAIMVAYTPFLPKDHKFNRALDACHAKGIGLISMKQVAGNGEKLLKEVPKHVPSLTERGLSAYQGLLHAIWTDERIACCCVSMHNTDQIREDTHAARVFEPLKTVEMEQLHRAILAAGPTMCANCDGSCSKAGGTEASLGDLTRYLTYHDQYGHRSEARRLYSELDPKLRDWSGADLVAARQACPNKLDFASLLPRVDETLA